LKVEAQILLPASPEVVWRRLLEWENQPVWMSDAPSVRVLTPHRDGTGVLIAVRTRVLGVPAFTEVLEVTAWDPPRRLELAHRASVRGLGEWRLEGDGAPTRFRWTERLSLPVPVLGELVLLAYRPFMRRLMRASVRNLAGWIGAN
jgi:Polyketide cyclase / dehydrase and lipid transport